MLKFTNNLRWWSIRIDIPYPELRMSHNYAYYCHERYYQSDYS